MPLAASLLHEWPTEGEMSAGIVGAAMFKELELGVCGCGSASDLSLMSC